MGKEGGIKIEHKRARSIFYFVLAETLSNRIEQIGGGKGRYQSKKNVFFRALPELPKTPPPHDPNSGNLVLFFRKLKFKI